MSYPLKPFQCDDWTRLARVIDEYPLATLISQRTPWPLVTQVPLVRHDRLLVGHFDGNNPHCAAVRAGEPVYALFSGPNHYISPTIYPDEQYPGWNYFTVHVEARFRARDARESLFELAQRHEDGGYRLSAEQRNFERYLAMVQGFELEVLGARGVFKLAQDKGPAHAARAARHLAQRSTRDISELLQFLLD